MSHFDKFKRLNGNFVKAYIFHSILGSLYMKASILIDSNYINCFFIDIVYKKALKEVMFSSF